MVLKNNKTREAYVFLRRECLNHRIDYVFFFSERLSDDYEHLHLSVHRPLSHGSAPLTISLVALSEVQVSRRACRRPTVPRTPATSYYYNTSPGGGILVRGRVLRLIVFSTA